MPTLGTLAAGIRSIAAVRRSEVYITELDDNDRPISNASQGAGPSIAQYRRFQYYPESVNDTKAVTYEPKEVPGGSLPIYQFVSSGERTISFTAYFTTDVDHLSNSEIVDSDAPEVQGDQEFAAGTETQSSSVVDMVNRTHTRLAAAGVQDRNPYIPAAIAWLRRFMFPRYGENAEVGVPLTKPPHKLLLHFTGSRIEVGGGAGGFSAPGGGILCVMTQCDVTYESFFPSGNPRIANVSLAFAEVPQCAGVIKFPSATLLDDDVRFYRLEARMRRGASGRGR